MRLPRVRSMMVGVMIAALGVILIVQDRRIARLESQVSAPACPPLGDCGIAPSVAAGLQPLRCDRLGHSGGRKADGRPSGRPVPALAIPVVNSEPRGESRPTGNAVGGVQEGGPRGHSRPPAPGSARRERKASTIIQALRTSRAYVSGFARRSTSRSA